MTFYGKQHGGLWEWTNKRELFDFLLSHGDYKGLYSADINKTTGVRTGTQNNALHKYYELLSNAFNDAGISVQLVLKEKMDLDWNERSVKELLWRPAQIALTGKVSTKELDKTTEINTIYHHLNRHISNKWGIYVPWPVKEEDKKPLPEYPQESNQITAF